MSRLRIVELAGFLIFALGLALAGVAVAADDIGPVGSAPSPLSIVTGYAHVVYARSDTDVPTETVISIRNQQSVDCSVTVYWTYGFGSTVAGQSGPVIIAPGDTQEFTTANSGELVAPFELNVYRNTTQDFEGKARVRADCAGTVAPVLAIQATLVVNINPATKIGASYMDLNIIRPNSGGNKGD